MSNKVLIEKDELHLCCIDPGIVNLGIRFETRQKIKNSIVIKDVINRTFTFENHPKTKDNENLFINLMTILCEYKQQLKKCDYILIEAQPNQKIKLCKIESNLYCLISYMVKDNKVHVIDSKEKYIYNLISTQHLKKSERKQVVGPRHAIKICEQYKDLETSKQIKEAKKKDELSDTVLMIEAFLTKYNFEGFYKETELSSNNIHLVREMNKKQLLNFIESNGLKDKCKSKMKVDESREILINKYKDINEDDVNHNCTTNTKSTMIKSIKNVDVIDTFDKDELVKYFAMNNIKCENVDKKKITYLRDMLKECYTKVNRLQILSLDKLKQICKQKDITISSKVTKDHLIELIVSYIQRTYNLNKLNVQTLKSIIKEEEVDCSISNKKKDELVETLVNHFKQLTFQT